MENARNEKYEISVRRCRSLEEAEVSEKYMKHEENYYLWREP